MLKEFVQQTPRPLPVLLLADASGSMASEGKIEALNQAIRDMLATFADAEDLRAEIQVGVIAFGGTAREHVPMQPASQVAWTDLPAHGGTPMGEAFRLAVDLLEDPTRISGRAYRPVLVLLSDGQPTDEYRSSMDLLVRQGRAQKADRLALAIGGDADEPMLQGFLNDSSKRVFKADAARHIKEFFQFVTMSVTTRSRSLNPNELPPAPDPRTLTFF